MLSSHQSAYFPGLDILKFALAILIVAAHCAFLSEVHGVARQIIDIVESFLIPTFFAVSAFLFFNKIDEPGAFKKYVKRIATIFLIWYVIMLPITYVTFFSHASINGIIFAILFSCTLLGYWYFKVLIINTVILYAAYKRGKLVFNIALLCAILPYCFVAYNSSIFHVNLMFWPSYTFYYNAAFFAVGVLFSKYYNHIPALLNKKAVLIPAAIVLTICCLNPDFHAFCRLIMPVVLLLIFINVKSSNSELCKKLRAMSILFYTMQFAIIYIYKYACNHLNYSEILGNSVLRLSIVLIMLYLASALFLRCEKRYKFLSYLH